MPLKDGRFRYQPLRHIASDAHPTYKLQRPVAPVDRLAHERPRRRPARPRPEPFVSSGRPAPEGWLWFRHYWYCNAQPVLAELRPPQLSARRLPKLEWLERRPTVWIGKLTFALPNGSEVSELIGCRPDRVPFLEEFCREKKLITVPKKYTAVPRCLED